MENGVWSRPELVEFTNPKYIYAYPFLTYDGKELYFISNQPAQTPRLEDEYNIWVTRKKGGRWETPSPLPPPINGGGSTSGPSVSRNGVLYYTLITDKEQAIYRSRMVDGEYTKPEKLPVEVNSTDNQFDGVIAPDESYLLLPVFNREDTLGSVDLYVTFRDKENNWSPVKNLGKIINTEKTESAARISADGKYIFLSGLYETHHWGEDPLSYAKILHYFTKPGGGREDIYWVDAEFIEELRPKKRNR
jgi:hypothetical protein